MAARLEAVLRKLSPEQAEQIRKVTTEPGKTNFAAEAEKGNFQPWVSAVLSASARVDFRDKDGFTLLHRLAWEEDARLVLTVLDAVDCPADVRDKDDQTPLMLASASGNLQVMKLFLDHNSDIYARRKDGMDATLLAAENEQTNALLVLQSRGADITVVDALGNSAAHFAARNNDVQSLRLLRAMGCPLDCKNADGCTPLHIAAETNSGQTAKFLLSAGCDRMARNKAGLSPVEVAEQRRSLGALRSFKEPKRDSLLARHFSVAYFTYLILLFGTWRCYIASATADYFESTLSFLISLLVSASLYICLYCGGPGCIPRQGDSLASSAVQQVTEKFEEENFDSIPSGQRFCLTCHLLRPQRSKHCSVCNQCIPLQDFHCVLLGKCVGRRNRRIFVAWLACTYSAALLHTYLEWTVYQSHIAEHSLAGVLYLAVSQWAHHPLPDQVVVIVNSCVIWFTGWHLLLMAYSVSTAQTANEVLNRHRYRYLFVPERYEDGSMSMVYRNPFFKSLVSSWVHFLTDS